MDLLTFCKATADVLRLDILCVLRAESYGVMELCRIFDTNQPNVSHHLKILARAELLQTRREGNSIFYRRAIISLHDPLADLKRHLFTAVDQMPISPEIESRCRSVHLERAQHSREFFSKNADRLKENQDLIAELSSYAASIEDLLNNETWRDKTQVVEIGPGESDLIKTLAQRFQRVLGIDNNCEMLNNTRKHTADMQESNIELRLAELRDLEPATANLVVMNMVLHHMTSPSAIFQDARRVLDDNGRLMIIDLCPHDQDWTRDACGDLWLGFSPTDIDNWASQADLIERQSAYLGLRNGFQVQLKLFQPGGATALH
jgi:ubiquinone/menaquinone biosynthesis C-methylase UbiE